MSSWPNFCVYVRFLWLINYQMCGYKYNNFVFITTIRNLWLWVVMTWKHTTHKKYFSQDIYMTWYNITAPKNIPHQLATHYCNISLGSIIVIQIWWRLVEYTIRLSIMGDDKYNYITGKMKKLIRVLLQNYFLYEIICLWRRIKCRMNDIPSGVVEFCKSESYSCFGVLWCLV